jgi:hypothetical protein
MENGKRKMESRCKEALVTPHYQTSEKVMNIK